MGSLLRLLVLVLACLATLVGGAFLVSYPSRGVPSEPAAVAPPVDRRVPDVVVPPRSLPPPSARMKPPAGFLVAHVRPGRAAAVHVRPSGPVVLELDAQTEFGSPRSLSVVKTRKGRWLGVVSPELGNGRVGWIDARARAVTYSRARVAIEVDLSRRELRLRAGKEIVRRMTVSIGRPGSPTPTGRFAVTDKLSGPRFSVYYGCCILALSGRQTNLPAGWTGGDRLAIHGTPDESGVGGASSAGCLRARGADLSALMRTVALGTPVVIHA